MFGYLNRFSTPDKIDQSEAQVCHNIDPTGGKIRFKSYSFDSEGYLQQLMYLSEDRKYFLDSSGILKRTDGESTETVGIEQCDITGDVAIFKDPSVPQGDNYSVNLSDTTYKNIIKEKMTECLKNISSSYSTLSIDSINLSIMPYYLMNILDSSGNLLGHLPVIIKGGITTQGGGLQEIPGNWYEDGTLLITGGLLEQSDIDDLNNSVLPSFKKVLTNDPFYLDLTREFDEDKLLHRDFELTGDPLDTQRNLMLQYSMFTNRYDLKVEDSYDAYQIQPYSLTVYLHVHVTTTSRLGGLDKTSTWHFDIPTSRTIYFENGNLDYEGYTKPLVSLYNFDFNSIPIVQFVDEMFTSSYFAPLRIDKEITTEKYIPDSSDNVTYSYIPTFSKETIFGFDIESEPADTLSIYTPEGVAADTVVRLKIGVGVNAQSSDYASANVEWVDVSNIVNSSTEDYASASSLSGEPVDPGKLIVELRKGAAYSTPVEGPWQSPIAGIEDVSIGSSSNMWGLDWTPEDLNSDTFGIRFRFTSTYENFHTDYITIDSLGLTVPDDAEIEGIQVVIRSQFTGLTGGKSFMVYYLSITVSHSLGETTATLNSRCLYGNTETLNIYKKTGIEVYRKIASIENLLDEYNDGTNTWVSDVDGDTYYLFLDQGIVPETTAESLDTYDHTPPVPMTMIIEHKDMIFGVKDGEERILLYSKVEDADYWPTTNYYSVRGAITGLAILGEVLYVFTRKGVYALYEVIGDTAPLLRLIDADSSVVSATALAHAGAIYYVNDGANYNVTGGTLIPEVYRLSQEGVQPIGTKLGDYRELLIEGEIENSVILENRYYVIEMSEPGITEHLYYIFDTMANGWATGDDTETGVWKGRKERFGEVYPKRARSITVEYVGTPTVTVYQNQDIEDSTHENTSVSYALADSTDLMTSTLMILPILFDDAEISFSLVSEEEVWLYRYNGVALYKLSKSGYN